MTTYSEQLLKKYTKNIRNDVLLILSEYFPGKLSASLIQSKIKNPVSHTKIFEEYLEKELTSMFKENIINKQESSITKKGKIVKISYLYFLK